MASTEAKRLPTSWKPRSGKITSGGFVEAGINVQEMMGAGRLEVLPWTDDPIIQGAGPGVVIMVGSQCIGPWSDLCQPRVTDL
jgi:hypothetical protein